MTDRSNSNESVIDYLASLRWDGTARLDRWLINCAGAADTPQVREVSRKSLIAAVRRARQPGCRLDQVLVLDGAQGCGKSSLLRTLAVRDAWFTDEFPLNPRGLVEATEGKWIVELTTLHPSNLAGLKACLSRQHDMYRKLYDHKVTQTPRQFVVIGTVSTDVSYLRDPAVNRRFCPVAIKHVDLQRLQAERDQLWAEAAAAEAPDESVRLDTTGDASAQKTWLCEQPDLERRAQVKA